MHWVRLRDTYNILQDFNMTKLILVCFNLTAKTSLDTLRVISLDHHMLLSIIPATANWFVRWIKLLICQGSDDDILALKKTLNDMGLKLMLDFVPNHSAVDCPYTSSNINYYVRAPSGTSDSSKYLSNGIAYGSACSGCGSWTYVPFIPSLTYQWHCSIQHLEVGTSSDTANISQHRSSTSKNPRPAWVSLLIF